MNRRAEDADLSITGSVFDIKRFATADGPGIRGLVFLKGCPLHCKWCSNPESQDPRPVLMYHRTKCVGCGVCIAVCPTHAIQRDATFGLITNHDECMRCGRCIDACLYGARELVGREVSIGSVMAVLRRDRLYYDNSGGGVTLTGGEPLAQCAFARELLAACQRENIHTAIETSGFAPWKHLESMLPFVDLLFYDLKHIDPEAHHAGSGASNEQILDNLKRVTTVFTSGEIVIRIPYIPGFNDADEVQESMYRLVSGLPNVRRIEVMPYHRFGMAKYSGLGREYSLAGIAPVHGGDIARLVKLGTLCGANVQVDTT